MDDFIADALDVEKLSPKHSAFLEDCKSLVAMSRSRMQSFYTTWDKNEDVFRGVTQPDKSDLSARERKEPEKMVVPITYSQIQTFVSFALSLLFQRDRLYELVGFTKNDERAARVGEALLARDLSYNQIKSKLSQFYTDIGRFSMGVMKICWHRELQNVYQQVPKQPVVFGDSTQLGSTGTTEVMQEVVAYEGNRIYNISPYRFYPDTRIPFVRFQEGEFVASDEMYSMAQLEQWEREGLVSGVKHIKPLTRDLFQTTGFRWNDWMADSQPGGAYSRQGDGQLQKMVIVTEMQRRITPSKYFIDERTPLGPEEYPVLYNFWLANNTRLIKAEPMGYVHNQFTYVMAPFLYDNNNLLGLGLADVIDQLQSVITWMINARITSVRKTIDNKFLINPKFINFQDVEQRRPYIRLLESAPGELERYIKQLNVQDVTQNHMQDAKFLHEMVQIVTGINDSLLGQFQPGRRSATEHRNTTTGSAARLKTIVQTTYDVAIEPMGRQMLSNLRDGLEEEVFVRLMGDLALEAPEFTKVTQADLAGNYDFDIFDGTLPSERQQVAQTLSELAIPFIQHPEAALALGYDIRKMLNEIMLLRGVKNPERFMVEPQPLAAAATGGNGNVAPNGQPEPGGVPSRNGGVVAEPVLPNGGGAY